MKRAALYLAYVFLFAPSTGWAQDADAVTPDRPGFGDGSAVVAPGRLQVEAGYAYTDQRDGGVHSIGQLWLRWGLLPQVELRAGLNSYNVRMGAGRGSGLDDAVIGAKWGLTRGDGQPFGRPASSMVLGVRLPTGSGSFAGEEAVLEGKFALDWSLSPHLGFSGNVGYETAGTFFYYLSLGGAFPGAERLGLFSGFSGSGPDHNGIDFGLTFLANPATQFDLNAGLVLDPVRNFMVGAGIARRL